MKRSEAREAAFLLVFEKSFSEEALAEIIDAAGEARDMRLNTFAQSLAEGAVSHQEEIDTLISAHAHNWQVSRLTKVSLAVLRVAVYELLYGEGTPEAVAINEAVELAKKYAGEEEAVFVNGVLGGVAREHEA